MNKKRPLIFCVLAIVCATLGFGGMLPSDPQRGFQHLFYTFLTLFLLFLVIEEKEPS
jgi:uncharacterized membrane protein YtjA (UPF0391 family)